MKLDQILVYQSLATTRLGFSPTVQPCYQGQMIVVFLSLTFSDAMILMMATYQNLLFRYVTKLVFVNAYITPSYIFLALIQLL
jgi:hypothetical protein